MSAIAAAIGNKPLSQTQVGKRLWFRSVPAAAFVGSELPPLPGMVERAFDTAERSRSRSLAERTGFDVWAARVSARVACGRWRRVARRKRAARTGGGAAS
jgi:hypothetical protein